MIKCFRCQLEKSKSHFRKDNRSKTGYVGVCKDCMRGFCYYHYDDVFCNLCHTFFQDFKFKKFNKATRTGTCRECYNWQCRESAKKPERRKVKLSHNRKYAIENREKETERHKAWRENNREKFNELSKDYYKRKRLLENTLTKEQEKVIFDIFKGCAICNKDEIRLDHWIPLSWEKVGTVMKNMIPLCDYHNSSKKNKNPNLWIEENDFDEQKLNLIFKHLSLLNDMKVEEYKDYIDSLDPALAL